MDAPNGPGHVDSSYALVAIGGAIGASLRYGVGLLLADARWPVAVTLVDVAGAFLLGTLVAILATGVGRDDGRDERVRALLGTGVLGSFTTFSGLAFGSADLAADHPLGGLAFALGTVIVGLVAARAGWVTGTRIATSGRSW